jgi:hypothetical protein
MPWADRETREKVLDFIRISRAQVGAKLGLKRVVISAAVENATQRAVAERIGAHAHDLAVCAMLVGAWAVSRER